MITPEQQRANRDRLRAENNTSVTYTYRLHATAEPPRTALRLRAPNAEPATVLEFKPKESPE